MLENLDIDLIIRITAFLGVLMVMLLWESIFPRRVKPRRLLRWPNNVLLFLFNAVMLIILPFSAIAASLIAIEEKIGVFIWLEFPFWPKVIICVVILDLLIYWQHRIFHQFQPLWKLHRVHHTDVEFDVTTALRFHPVEIALSVIIKMGAIILLGAPLFAVILFEVILNGSAMFNHANAKLPLGLDRLLRLLIVTPDMHRVHHSVHSQEHNANYGFCLSLWDRFFGSYVSQPKDGHEFMQIGLNKFNRDQDARFDKLLIQPFK